MICNCATATSLLRLLLVCVALPFLSLFFFFFFFKGSGAPRNLPSSPTRRSSDLRRDTTRDPAVTSSSGQTAGHSIHVGLDRKSTRLNSSHLGISYAVFCLKKK